MLDAEKMTPMELRILASDKEKELWLTPVREGFVTKDLYEFNDEDYSLLVDDYTLYTKSQKDNLEEKMSFFKLVFTAGERLLYFGTSESGRWSSEDRKRIAYRHEKIEKFLEGIRKL